MMIYCFICGNCDNAQDAPRPVEDHALPETCDTCGKTMKRDYLAERCSVRGNYGHKIVSDSMAFDSRDLAAHRQKFPDVDVVVDGSSMRPVFTSLTQKRKYLKEVGYVDQNSFTG